MHSPVSEKFLLQIWVTKTILYWNSHPFTSLFYFFGDYQVLMPLVPRGKQPPIVKKAKQKRKKQVTLQFFILYHTHQKEKKSYTFVCFIYVPLQYLLTDPSPCSAVEDPGGICCSLSSISVPRPTLIPFHCKQIIIISLVFQSRINWLIYTWINCINVMFVIGAWYDLK